MGHEYSIRFHVPADFSAETLAQRLPSARSPNSDWAEYDYSVGADGFYFVDHGGRREISSLAFRVLIDEALRHDRSVVVEEA